MPLAVPALHALDPGAVPGLVPGDRLDGANARLMATQVVGNDAVGAPIGALELPAVTYGGFLVALAAGGLTGGVVAERVLRRTGSEAVIRGGFAVAVLCYAAVALARHPVIVGVIAAVLGAVSMVVNVAARTLRQRLVLDPMLGRVTASMAAVAIVTTPIGAVVAGAVAEWLGVAAVGWFAAATNLVALLLLSRVGR